MALMFGKIHLMHVPGTPERDDQIAWWREHYPAQACVHEDPERRGVLWNHLQILDCAVNDEGPWSLVVQDDARPLPNWEIHLDQVSHYAPSPFVSLCHFGQYGEKLVKVGVPFGVSVNAIWGQAVLYSHAVLRSYREFAHQVAELDYDAYRKWDDGLVAVFNVLHGTTSAFTARALFEHQEWQSTMGHLQFGRQAAATVVTRPFGPPWGAKPAFRRSGPGPDAPQKALIERLRSR